MIFHFRQIHRDIVSIIPLKLPTVDTQKNQLPPFQNEPNNAFQNEPNL